MQATSTRVIIKKLASAMTTEGGIILHRPQERVEVEVVSVGSKVTADIKVGDDLILEWNRVGRMEYLEQEYFVIDESDILAVVDPT